MSVFVCSDLHGNGRLWAAIKKFLKPEDRLFYLGDATDRGPDGWEILKEMLEDERITYIAGNHDIMLADRIERPSDYRIAGLHNSNGGATTWDAVEEDASAPFIGFKLRKLPLYAVYENTDGKKIFMSHSGATTINNSESLIWNRDHYYDMSKPEDYDYIVHGHTPVPYLVKDLKDSAWIYEDLEVQPQIDQPWYGGAYWYSPYKCCIDCCTIITELTVLLDLDTFDEVAFKLSDK